MLEGDYIRRGVAEFVGTFALLFIACGGAAYARTPTDLALANGFAIGVMVVAVGFISGGFFNPAITLGFLVTRRISPVLAVWYWLVQFGAAALAVLLVKCVLPAAPQAGAKLGLPALAARCGVFIAPFLGVQRASSELVGEEHGDVASATALFQAANRLRW